MAEIKDMTDEEYYDYCKTGLTTRKMAFRNDNKTPFSIDLTITKLILEKWNKLIHFITGDSRTDKWE